MLTRAHVAFVAIGLAGCGYDVTRVDGGGLELEYAVMIVLDRAGAPLRVGPPFGVGKNGINFGSAPHVVFEGEEDRAVIVGFDRASLAAVWPGTDQLPPERLRVIIAPPPEEALLVFSGSNKEVRAAVPVAAKVMSLPELADVGPGLFDALTLILPLDPDPPSPPLEAFGVRHHLLEAGELVRGQEVDTGFERFVVLDESHLIALSDSLLAVVERGGTVDRTPYDPNGSNRTITLFDISMMSARFTDLVLLAPDTLGQRKLLVVGREMGRGTIWELALENNALRFLGRVAIEPDARLPVVPPLFRIIEGQRGAVIIGGDQGVILARRPEVTPFSIKLDLRMQFANELARAEGDPSQITMLRATKSPGEPHLIGAESGALFEGDALNGRFRVLMKTRELSTEAQNVHINDVDLEGDEQGGDYEMWVAGRYGHLFHRPKNGVFSPIVPVVPPQLEPCASRGSNGRFRLGQHFLSVRLSATHVYLLQPGCNALIRLRRTDLCPGTITRESAPVRASVLDFCAMHSDRSRFWLAGEEGGLIELRAAQD